MLVLSASCALLEALASLGRMLTPAQGVTENPCAVSGACERVTLPSYLQHVPKIRYQFWPLTGSKKRHFRMLCIDGGGVRSIFAARILERLTDAVPGFLDHVDLIAGSSTGCITVLLLGLGYSPRQIMALYRESMPSVFETSLFRRLNPFRSRYSGLEKFQQIHGYVGDMCMSDLQRFIMITAFCVDAIGDTEGVKPTWAKTQDTWRPALFTNMPKGKGRVEPDNDLLLVDAAMRCTAGPAFYPIYQGYVDGAVFGSNPSLSALSRAMESFPDSVTTDNAAVLSVGNGSSDYAVPGKYHDWGIIQWAPKLIGLLFEGTETSIDVTLRMLLGKRYLRIKNTNPLHAAIDDIKSFEKVVEFADKVDLSDAIAFVKNEILEVDSTRRMRANSIADPVSFKRHMSLDTSSNAPPPLPMSASAYVLSTPPPTPYATAAGPLQLGPSPLASASSSFAAGGSGTSGDSSSQLLPPAQPLVRAHSSLHRNLHLVRQEHAVELNDSIFSRPRRGSVTVSASPNPYSPGLQLSQSSASLNNTVSTSSSPGRRSSLFFPREDLETGKGEDEDYVRDRFLFPSEQDQEEEGEEEEEEESEIVDRDLEQEGQADANTADEEWERGSKMDDSRGVQEGSPHRTARKGFYLGSEDDSPPHPSARNFTRQGSM